MSLKSPYCFQLRGVTLYGTDAPRLNEVSLAVLPGRTAVVGYSGAGKTSLLNVLAGFERPDAGEVTCWLDEDPANQQPVVDRSWPVPAVSGTSARGPAALSRVSPDSHLPLYWVPQNGGLWSHLTVEQHLFCANENRKLTDEILQRLDLSLRRRAFPVELSQGERGRLALARALATQASVLLMDEPLSHVDPVRKPAYWDFVEELLSVRKSSMVFSTHESETILRRSEFVICLHEGRVVFQGKTRHLYDTPTDRFAGEFLGPLNWFDGEDQSRFLNQSQHVAFGIRPERLILVCSEESALEFDRSIFQGAYEESLIKDTITGRTRTILHQRMNSTPEHGQKICLKVIH